MKKWWRNWGALVRLAVCAFWIVAVLSYRVLAQDEAPIETLPVEPDTNALWLTFITAAVPLLLAWLKRLVREIPGWMIPVLAPFAGALLDTGLHYTGIYASSQPLLGAAAGMAGVGLREIIDQSKKGTAPPKP